MTMSRQKGTYNTYNTYKNLPTISQHKPFHKKELSDLDFGYFLAGLIEADGWFGEKTLHIIFAMQDVTLAYFIKKRIGYGNVYKIKNKKAVRYICRNNKGLHYVISLINGKLVSFPKYNQLLKHNYSEWLSILILPPSERISLGN